MENPIDYCLHFRLLTIHVVDFFFKNLTGGYLFLECLVREANHGVFPLTSHFLLFVLNWFQIYFFEINRVPTFQASLAEAESVILFLFEGFVDTKKLFLFQKHKLLSLFPLHFGCRISFLTKTESSLNVA